MADERRRPIQPARPIGLELVFLYPCPHCGGRNPIVAPTQPSMARCESCGGQFPIIPVDAKTVAYVKLILANGRAGIDPDFL